MNEIIPIEPGSRLFVIWAFTLQLLLVLHFAVRKPFYDSYTLKFGWLVYALALPGFVISIILYRKGMSWSFWLGGLLYLIFSLYGFWVDYLVKIPFRSPFQPGVGVPFVILYLGSMMFYWWPVGFISRSLWFIYGLFFVIGTILNITSH